MSANLAAFLYLVAGVLFILALRGLSHPRRPARAIASAWSAWRSPSSPRCSKPPRAFGELVLIVIGIAIGGGIGA